MYKLHVINALPPSYNNPRTFNPILRFGILHLVDLLFLWEKPVLANISVSYVLVSPPYVQIYNVVTHP